MRSGLVALTSTAFSWARHPTDKISSSYLFWSLWLISLGQGGYNPSLQAFGADQIANDDELPSTEHDKKSNKKSLFFQWWYFGICGGSLAGVTVMSYIQDTFGWVLGFAIPTVAMVASIFLLWCGGRIYAYKQDDALSEKPSRDIVRSIKEALSRLMSSRITLSNNNPEVVELELQEKPLCQNPGSTKGSKEGRTCSEAVIWIMRTRQGAEEGLASVRRLIASTTATIFPRFQFSAKVPVAVVNSMIDMGLSPI
ncbi:hypothetical protein OIU84_028627 [Salix udensis]|uniref:Uncharacterized protein n=1 Tax=Salix udensis TaxID=889485 RepID=A0AAD6P971_9ROSI|nr:hypothetical protein OIU84_028627 [Salix udensis]KAJ6421290.1 hypothetical protein OIU84_028627 [Salix udensis]